MDPRLWFNLPLRTQPMFSAFFGTRHKAILCVPFFCSRGRKKPYAQEQSLEVMKREVRVTEWVASSWKILGWEWGEGVMTLGCGEDSWGPRAAGGWRASWAIHSASFSLPTRQMRFRAPKTTRPRKRWDFLSVHTPMLAVLCKCSL